MELNQKSSNVGDLRIHEGKQYFLTQTTPDDNEVLIGNIELNKGVVPNSNPVRTLKDYRSESSKPLSDMINTSFTTGIFPNALKGEKQACQMMTIYFVWVQRINFSNTLSVLTATFFFIISKHFSKTSSLRRIT